MLLADLVEYLDPIRVLVDVAIVILIWLVQLIIYPSFLFADARHFKKWHFRYTGLITFFVIPLMFGQLGIYACLCWVDLRWHDWAGAGLIGLAWLATFCLSVPCHDQMQKSGYDRAVIWRLVNTNWIRTAVWTACFAINLPTLF